jgi:hypothetical protein
MVKIILSDYHQRTSLPPTNQLPSMNLLSIVTQKLHALRLDNLD